VVINGTIIANGGNGGSNSLVIAGGGGGSGGAIWIQSKGNISGTGNISVNGGTGGAGSSGTSDGGNGGKGRIRLDDSDGVISMSGVDGVARSYDIDTVLASQTNRNYESSISTCFSIDENLPVSIFILNFVIGFILILSSRKIRQIPSL
jgi:hypothetical protein